MPQNFLGCDREQPFLLPPSLDEWLPEDHFARFVIAAVGAMDLTAFYTDDRADGHGRPAHDPAMMVSLLVYAYACGQRSSRGDRRGDELPPELASAQGRKKWLEAAKRRLDTERAQEARPIPADRPARVKEAKRRLEQELLVEQNANAAYEAYRARGVMRNGRRFGSPPKPYTPPQQPAGKINVTDPDSRNLKTPRGYLQGYNAQAVCNEQRIVIAAEVSVSSADFGQMGPMVASAESELAAVGVTDAPHAVLADAGYWHGEQIDELMGRGIRILIPPDANKRKGTRPGWNGGRYAFMRRVLDTEAAGDLYRKRQQLIEPVFADTKFNRRIDRFLRRGRAAARSEWRLITATGNLLKLWRHTTAPAAA